MYIYMYYIYFSIYIYIYIYTCTTYIYTHTCTPPTSCNPLLVIYYREKWPSKQLMNAHHFSHQPGMRSRRIGSSPQKNRPLGETKPTLNKQMLGSSWFIRDESQILFIGFCGEVTGYFWYSVYMRGFNPKPELVGHVWAPFLAHSKGNRDEYTRARGSCKGIWYTNIWELYK